MGSEEIKYYIYYDIYSRLEIVALSAWPLGVNKLCVCVKPSLRIVLSVSNTLVPPHP